jgi:hypothetical protein
MHFISANTSKGYSSDGSPELVTPRMHVRETSVPLAGRASLKFGNIVKSICVSILLPAGVNRMKLKLNYGG